VLVRTSCSFARSTLTKEGIKTTSSSLLWRLEQIGEPVLQVGVCGIVADGENNPICILKLTEVEIRPFNEVDAHSPIITASSEK
jgi:uncharacterized protein YhfF